MKVLVYNSRSGELHVWGPCDTAAQKKKIAKKFSDHLDSICVFFDDGVDEDYSNDLDKIVELVDSGCYDCGYADVVDME